MTDFDSIKKRLENDLSYGIGLVDKTTIGHKLVEVAASIAKPYRDTAAPALTAGLMVANRNYQEQNKNLSTMELFQKAKQDAIASSQEYYNNDPSQAWRRKISPGRALIGLMGSVLPGEQAVDKIDWADANKVEDFFSHGSAEMWSGIADVGFNFADPVLVAAKGAKVAGKEALSRPVKEGVGTKFYTKKFIEQRKQNIGEDIDNAVVGKPSPIKPLFDALAAKDILTVRKYGPIASSNNPQRLTQALIDAYHVDGIGNPELAGNVLKAAIGDVTSYESVRAHYPKITAQLNAVTGRLDAIEKHIVKIQNSIIPDPRTSHPSLTALEIARIESFNLKAAANIKILEKEIKKVKKEELKPLRRQENLLSNVIGATPTTAEEAARLTAEEGQKSILGSMNNTWSRSEAIETRRLRNAQLQMEGFWSEYSHETMQFAKDMATAHGREVRGLRVVDWISPNGKLHETPAGIATIDGIAGEFSQAEIDARLRQAVKYGKLSADTAKNYSIRYGRLQTSGQRYQFLEQLQKKSVLSIIKKEHADMFIDAFGKPVKLSAKQNETLRSVVSTMIEATSQRRRNDIKSIVEKQYTVVDKTGKIIVSQHIQRLVDDAAKRIAENRNGIGAEVTERDTREAIKSLTENPALTSQIPNVHFAIDLRTVRDIIRENPGLFEGIIQRILENDEKVLNDVRKYSENAASADINGVVDTAANAAERMGLGIYDKTKDSIDAFYTFLWKPQILFSLKYTTRNVFEGWLRTGATMMDMNAAYGYSYSDQIRGFAEGKLISPITFAKNSANRAVAARARSKFNEINKQLNLTDLEIDKAAGPLTISGTKVAKKIIKKSRDKADAAVYAANDGVSMTAALIKGKFQNLENIATGHSPNIGAVEANKIYFKFMKDINLSSSGNDFLSYLLDQDFRTSTARLLSLDITEAQKTLDHFVNVSLSASANLEKLIKKYKNGVVVGPVTIREMEELKYFLERVPVHTAHLDSFLVERHNLLLAAQDIAGKIKPNVKKTFTKESQLEGLPGAFSGGAGEMMRAASSAHTSTMRTLDRDMKITGSSILSNGTKRAPIDINDPLWAVAHTEYINNVLMNDAAARKAVDLLASGKSLTDTQKELHRWVTSNEQDALTWRRERTVNYQNRNERVPSNWKNEVDIVLEGQVMTNLKPVDAFGDSLIIKASNGKLTPTDSATIPQTIRNPIVGDIELKNAPATVIFKNIVRTLFKAVGSLPEDHLVRHPFYNMVYNAEANRLANLFRSQGKDVNEYLPQIRYNASARAYKELMQRLYSVERYTDLATTMRWISPFYMAHQNSSRFWLGTSLRNPDVAVMLAKGYNAPYRGGHVQDKNGKTISWSNPWANNTDTAILHLGDDKVSQWIKRNTGQDYVGFQPSALDVIFQGQIPAFQTIGGPLGQLAGTALLGYLADKTFDNKGFLGKLGTNADEIQKYIMPYYSKTYGQSIPGQALSTLSPFSANSWIWSVIAAKSQGEFSLDPDVNTRFQSRYEAAYDNIAIQNNLDGTAFSDAEMVKLARERAVNSLYVEALSSFVGPVVAGKLGNKNYTQLNQEWNSILREKKGNTDEAAVELTRRIEQRTQSPYSASVSRILTTRSASNRFGLWATPQTSNNFLKNKSLVQKIDVPYPDQSLIGVFFNEGNTATDYSAITDDNYFSVEVNGKPLRERLTTDVDRRRNQQYSQGWEVYTNAIEYINLDAKNHKISKGSAAWNAYYKVWQENVMDVVSKQYPLWGDRVKGFQQNKSDINISVIKRFMYDSNYMSTVGNRLDTVKAIKDYMDAREVIKSELDAYRDKTGVKSIDSKSNAWFAEWRDNVVASIADKHPGFQSIYNRYLQDDTFDNRVDYSSTAK